MLTRRSQIGLLVTLTTVVSLYLLLPLTASYLLAQGLRQYGYKNVIIQLGYPGLQKTRIPVVSFQQDLGSEDLTVSLTDVEIHYRVARLFRGHVDRVILPYVAVQILNIPVPERDEKGDVGSDQTASDESPWSLLTAGDLMRRLPILPFDEVRLDRVTIFREQATGPLRKVTISGVVMFREDELAGHLSFQGSGTASYGLTVTGNSASTWTATLASQRLQTVPIISWTSEAHPDGLQVRVNGQLEVNVRELAPFIALLIPIGPELGKVTGHVAVSWVGTAATEATLTSVWRDSRTYLEGHLHANMTLPALKGMAKDIAVAYQGAFKGNAVQVGWTLDPGVLLSATVNAQPHLIPELVRTILPRGDQPVRIENTDPVRGMLYWAEVPVRMTIEGPLHVTYGRAPGPLVAEFETTRAEGVGSELVLAEGTYHIEGLLPKTVTDLLSAREATGGIRGTITLARTHIQGILLPGSSITAKQIMQGSAAVASVTLELAEALPLQCDLPVVRCTVGPAMASIRIPSLRVMDRDVRMGQGALRIEQADATTTSWNAHGLLTVDGMLLDLSPWTVPATNWKVKFAANQAGVKADLRVDAPFQESIVAAKIEQPLGTGKGVLHGTIGPIGFDSTERRLSKLLKGVPLSMDLTGGQVTTTIDAAWSSGVGVSTAAFQVSTGTATVVVDKLSVQYRDYAVKGLSTTVSLRAQGLESIATVQPAAVTIASVQTGIEVINLRTTLQGTWGVARGQPVVEAKDFQCEVFGGTVTSPGLVIDLAKPPFRTTFSLNNLDLAKILSVEQQQGLQGSGILNGTLPIAITSSGVSVKDGLVEAQPPGGVIRYGITSESSQMISETDSNLDLVSQALNNFHYALLRVGVDYGESGALLLSARLEGRNPDLHKSPPIHFNLTVQEHIPTLLKSLRLVEGIENAVQKKYKHP